jgi:hypothetical protein
LGDPFNKKVKIIRGNIKNEPAKKGIQNSLLGDTVNRKPPTVFANPEEKMNVTDRKAAKKSVIERPSK